MLCEHALDVGVWGPIPGGGKIGGIYQDGRLGILEIIPIKLPDGQIIKIEGFYIDKNTWEIMCTPFEIN